MPGMANTFIVTIEDLTGAYDQLRASSEPWNVVADDTIEMWIYRHRHPLDAEVEAPHTKLPSHPEFCEWVDFRVEMLYNGHMV